MFERMLKKHSFAGCMGKITVRSYSKSLTRTTAASEIVWVARGEVQCLARKIRTEGGRGATEP